MSDSEMAKALIVLATFIFGPIILLGLYYIARGSEKIPANPRPRVYVDSPFLASSRRERAWYPAVTPGGTRMSGWCCRRGHSTGDMAAWHAREVEDLVRRTGRSSR